VVVSLLGLGFAIWQLSQLRGETRASREASEATRKAIGRDLAIADLSGTREQIQTVKDLHRRGEWDRALSRYPDIQKVLTDIRYRYPELSSDDAEKIQKGIRQLGSMESSIDRGTPYIRPEVVADWNQELIQIQVTLAELENQLRQLT
jgi:hypothetical protein